MTFRAGVATVAPFNKVYALPPTQRLQQHFPVGVLKMVKSSGGSVFGGAIPDNLDFLAECPGRKQLFHRSRQPGAAGGSLTFSVMMRPGSVMSAVEGLVHRAAAITLQFIVKMNQPAICSSAVVLILAECFPPMKPETVKGGGQKVVIVTTCDDNHETAV